MGDRVEVSVIAIRLGDSAPRRGSVKVSLSLVSLKVYLPGAVFLQVFRFQSGPLGYPRQHPGPYLVLIVERDLVIQRRRALLYLRASCSSEMLKETPSEDERSSPWVMRPAITSIARRSALLIASCRVDP